MEIQFVRNLITCSESFNLKLLTTRRQIEKKNKKEIESQMSKLSDFSIKPIVQL